MLHLESLESRVLLASGITFNGAFGAWGPDPLDFGDAGVGRTYDDVLQITNSSGGTVTIDQINFTGNGYSLFKPIPGIVLPDSPYTGDQYTLDQLQDLPTGTLNDVPYTFIDNPGVANDLAIADDVYQFDAVAGEEITVKLRGEQDNIASLGIYTVDGTEIAFAYGAEYAAANVSFVAGYTGRYFVSVTDDSTYLFSQYDLQLERGNVITPEWAVPAFGETDSVEGATYYARMIRQGMPLIPLYVAPEQFGETVTVSFTPETEGSGLLVGLLDPYGEFIGAVDTAGFEDEMTTEVEPTSFSFAFQFPGIYSIILVPADPNLIIEELDYELSMENIGSILDIPDGESIDIPLWLAPDHVGHYDGTARVTIDGVISPALALTATAVTGNAIPDDVDFSDLVVPQRVQAGESHEVQVTVTNQGLGDLDNDTVIGFWLSTDTSLDFNDDVELPTRLDLSAELIRSNDSAQQIFPADNAVVITGNIDLPAGLDGQYYLFAVVDPDNTLAEYNELPSQDQVISNDFFFIAPGDLLVTDPDYIEDDPLTTDVDEQLQTQYDRMVDLGQQGIGTISTTYITFTNRSHERITLTSYSLAQANAFVLPATNGLTRNVNVPVPPGLQANVPVLFTPQAFLPGQDPVQTNTLYVTTNQGETYAIELTAEMIGSTIQIDEQSGTENDNLIEFGQVLVGDPQTIPFTIRNIGTRQLQINNISFASGAASAFSTDFPGSIVQLDPADPVTTDDEITFNVTFSPSATGLINGTMIIHNDSVNLAFPVSLTGTAIAPQLAVSDSLGSPSDRFMPFPWQPAGSQTTQTVTLQNTGTAPLTLTGWQLAQPLTSGFTLPDPNDPASAADDILLAPGELYTLNVTYAPSVPLTAPDTLTVYTDQLGQATVALQGLSADAGYAFQPLSSPDTTVDLIIPFGEVHVGDTDSRSFFLVNINEVPIDLQSLSIAHPAFAISTPNVTLPTSIASGSRILIQVNFDPSLANLGDIDTLLQVNSNAPATANAAFLATAVKAEFVASRNTIDFGEVDESGQLATQPFFLHNDGTGDLVISHWAFSSSEFSLQVPPEYLADGDIVIGPGDTATLAIAMTPGAPGNINATLQLLTNDPDPGDDNVSIAIAATNLGQPLFALPDTWSTFRDDDGHLVKIIVKNGGQAQYYLQNGNATGADIARITLLDTNPDTQVIIRTVGGQTSVNEIVADDPVDDFNAPQLILDGDAEFAAITDLALADILDDSALTVGLGRNTSLQAGRIGDNVQLTFADDLVKLTADSYQSGHLSAASIGDLTLRRGRLGADLFSDTFIGDVSVRDDIDGDIYAFTNVESVLSQRGSIRGSIIAERGSIGDVAARNHIGDDPDAWTIFSYKTVDSIVSRRGHITGVIRAANIEQIRALELDNAFLSTLDDVELLILRGDLRESFILAGYDIGRDGQVGTLDDAITTGNIGLVRFNGEFDQSYIGAGIITDSMYAALGVTDPARTLTPSNVGSLDRIQGRSVRIRPGSSEFGLYAVRSINTNLDPVDNFVILPNL